MYKQIQTMLYDYHQFASRPSLLELQDIIPAVRQGKILTASRHRKPRVEQVVKVLNAQWRSMSNTYPHCLAVNEKPAVKQGFVMPDGTSEETGPDSWILVAGYRPVVADLMVYTKSTALRYVYFSLNENRFVSSVHPAQGLVPLKEIFNRPAGVKVYSDLKSKSIREARRNDAALRQILDEILEKWRTFVFPVCFCHGLTGYQQSGWQEAIKRNRKKGR